MATMNRMNEKMTSKTAMNRSWNQEVGSRSMSMSCAMKRKISAIAGTMFRMTSDSAYRNMASARSGGAIISNGSELFVPQSTAGMPMASMSCTSTFHADSRSPTNMFQNAATRRPTSSKTSHSFFLRTSSVVNAEKTE